MMKKIICMVICLLQIVALFCGCSIGASEVESIPYKTKASIVPSGTVAQSGDYKLEWDADRCSLAIFKGEDVVWASMPIDQYLNNTQEGAVKKYIESHIVVDYKDEATNTLTNVVSYIGAVEDGRVYSYLVKDGIRILYCFDKQCFAIPVIYRLKNGYLDVMIENSKIYECGNEVYQISVLPYSGAVENSADSRIFVPDGSGMIMNCDLDRNVRNYSGKVYGNDGAEPTSYKFVYEDYAHLPVFAVTNPSDGTYCSIINEGAPAVTINASAGDPIIGYSYAYATFKIRGSETVKIPQGWDTVSITGQYSDISRSSRMQMRIAFLDEYDKNFSSVANYYRDYLVEEKGLTKKGEEKLLYIDIPMALAQREFFFGLPHDVTKSITTYDQCLEILSDIYDNTGVASVARLSGIQSGGLEVTKIAGGFSTEKVLGSKKQLQNLIDTLKESKIEVFPDFDITRFRKSSNGYSIRSDSVKSATSMSSTQYFYSISTGEARTDTYTYYLLSPSSIYSAAEKLLGKIKKLNIGNLSLGTVGNSAYSDYGYEKGYIGADYLKQFGKISSLLASNNIKVMYDSANEYSAVTADYIINAPTGTSNYNAQDEWLPFYEMVFKGYVPMSCQSINLSDITKTELLKAVQCGIGLSFTVCGDETLDYSTSKFPQLLSGSYENSKESIIEMVKDTQDVLKEQAGAQLNGVKMISVDVYQSDFSNGNSVIVNYSDKDYNYNGYIVKALDYILLGGE